MSCPLHDTNHTLLGDNPKQPTSPKTQLLNPEPMNEASSPEGSSGDLLAQSVHDDAMSDIIEVSKSAPEVIDLTGDDDGDDFLMTIATSTPRQTIHIKTDPKEDADFESVQDESETLKNEYFEDVCDEARDDANLMSNQGVTGEELPELTQEVDLEFVWQDNEVTGREAAAMFALYGLDNTNGEDTHMEREPYQQQHDDNDIDAEDLETRAAFQALKRQYMQKVMQNTATVTDEIAFKRADDAEKLRVKLLERRRTYQSPPPDAYVAADQSLFVLDDEVRKVPPYFDFSRQSGKKSRRNRNYCRLGRSQVDSSEDDLENDMEKLKRRGEKRGRKPKTYMKKKDPKAKVSKQKVKKGSGKVPKPKPQKASRYAGPEMSNIASLLHHDIVATAQANKGKQAQHNFTKKDRKGALTELIASIPEGERTIYKPDQKKLHQACKVFGWKGNGSMHSTGAGRWNLKGTNTSLESFQVLGCAWIREREVGLDAPYGGIVADSMGLGKTIQMLINAVEGQPRSTSPNQTMLVVCPSSLCNQWLQEINKHVQTGVLGEVMIYRSGSRVQSADPIKTLKSCGVVITTYNEVMKNFPKAQQPVHLVSQNAIDAWWTAHFEENKGPLLRINWHRVVLDEGQIIKNYRTRTSVACAELSGKYRWVLTGTPFMNDITELYAYLKFLRCPSIGHFETFKANFCGKTNTSTSRIHTLLRKIMLRRTAADEIFGRPIVKLMNLSHETIAVDFTNTERAIYQIVRSRFLNRINEWITGGCIQRNSGYILVMLLRLRQLCAHVLLVAPVLRELLEVEDLEKLWRITAQETTPTGPSNAVGTMTVLRKYIENKKTAASTAGEQPVDKVVSTMDDEMLEAVELPNTLTGAGNGFKFRGYLRGLYADRTWDEVLSRSLCHKCHELPQNPQFTQECQHLYCEECLLTMIQEASLEGTNNPVCLECSKEFSGYFKPKGAKEVAFSSSPRAARLNRSSADSDDSDFAWLKGPGLPIMSTKTQAVRNTIVNWLKIDPDQKIIVFCQFLGMLRILQKVCNYEKWGVSKYNGTMTPEAKGKQIQEFRDDPEKKILLCSMRAGSLGLNLTMASRCLIVDPWWNESVESQSYSRIYRIGQQKDVEVKRIVIKDTIDTKLLLKMQERKSSEIRRVLNTSEHGRALSTDELIRLFGPVQNDEETGLPMIEEGEDEDFILPEPIFVQDDSEGEHPGNIPDFPFEI